MLRHMWDLLPDQGSNPYPLDGKAPRDLQGSPKLDGFYHSTLLPPDIPSHCSIESRGDAQEKWVGRHDTELESALLLQ